MKGLKVEDARLITEAANSSTLPAYPTTSEIRASSFRRTKGTTGSDSTAAKRATDT